MLPAREGQCSPSPVDGPLVACSTWTVDGGGDECGSATYCQACVSKDQHQRLALSETLLGVQRAYPGHTQKRATQPDSLPSRATLGTLEACLLSPRQSAGEWREPCQVAAMLLESHLGTLPLVCDATASGPTRRINLPSSETRCLKDASTRRDPFRFATAPRYSFERKNRDESAVFVDVFCSRVKALRTGSLGSIAERKQKLVLVGNASHTEGDSVPVPRGLFGCLAGRL